MLVNIIQNTISSFRSALAAAEVITTNLKMWLGFETSETIGKNIYDGRIISGVNGGTFTDNGDGTFTVTGDGSPNVGIGVRDFDADYLTVGGTYKFSAQGANTTLAVYNSSFSLLTTGVSSVEFQATTTSIKLYISPTNGVTATYSDVEVRQLTQITPDKSGNNNVGELFTGKALDFNGSTDYVNTTGFEMAGTSATFAFWIYPKDTAYQFVMDLDGTVRTILGLFNGGSGQVFAFFNFGFKQFGTPTQNQWQRVVFRVNATTVECYVDGVKSGSTVALTSSIDLSTVGNSVIGGRFDTSNTGNRFDGSLSDFQIYNAYWSTDDIAYDYANPNKLAIDNPSTSLSVTNLKGYWAMSEGAGSLVYDSSGEGNNGTINGATYEPAQPRIPQLGMMDWAKSTPVSDEVTLIPNPNNTSQDILGNAVRDRLNSFNLDGSGYAEVADDTDLDIGTGAFTMECWVKADFENTGSSINIICILGGEYANTDTASISTDSTKFLARIGNNNLTADNNYTVGDWYHICITRDDSASGLCTLYIDAVAQADTETTNDSITNTSTKQIGRDNLTSRFYKNLISDVRLYKGKGLSAEEVENNYNAGLSAHTN